MSWSNEVKGRDLRLLVSQPDRKRLKNPYQSEKAAKFFTCADENRENWAPLISMQSENS